MTLEERFWPKVERNGPDECWPWKGATLRGYGRFRAHGRTAPAHRVAYELLVGPIPDGLQIDHLCRTPLCVNPAHLEAVTARENILRGVGVAAVHARKTHCIHGHEFSLENTYIGTDGGRRCRTCIAGWNRARSA